MTFRTSVADLRITVVSGFTADEGRSGWKLSSHVDAASVRPGATSVRTGY